MLTALALFPIGALGLALMVPIGLAAVTVLVVLSPPLNRTSVGYALVLGALATVGGMIERSASSGGLGTAFAQLPLVSLCFLAVWTIAVRVGWVSAGIGVPTVLTRGWSRGLRDFGVGFALAAPWALGNVATGP